MLLVIFGAGASFDSLSTYPPGGKPDILVDQSRPPLANGLFENRGTFAAVLENYPQCHAIVPFLRNLQGRSIEQVLEELRDEARTSGRRLQQLAAVRCYLRQLLGDSGDQWYNNVAKGITNYATLLDEIENQRIKNESVYIVSFNYDRLLDLALRTVGIQITGLDSYVNNSTYKLFKIHGSVNWTRRISTPIESARSGATAQQIRDEIITRVAELEITDHYEMTLTDYRSMSSGYEGRFPAIAIPVEMKSTFECPPDHLSALREAIHETDRVLIVGWRAMEKHFVQLLKGELRQKVRGLIVNGKVVDGEFTLNQITNAGIDGAFDVANGGFSDFVISRQFRRWLP